MCRKTSLYVLLGASLVLTACNGNSGSGAEEKDEFLQINTLLVQNACSNCHGSDHTRVGPSMRDIAAVRGPDTPDARMQMAERILNGVKGNWGEAIMPVQKQVTPQKAEELAQAILALHGRKPPQQ
jgi:cytochrome c